MGFTNTVVTVDRALIKENVGNIIYNLDPTRTPFLSSVQRRPTTNITFETPQDSYVAPAHQAVKQGQDIGDNQYDAAASASKVKGYTHIMDKALRISDTVRKVMQYGYSDELAYQLAKKSVELKRDMELQLCSNRASVKPAAKADPNQAEQDAATQTGGIASWIKSNFKSLKSAPTGAATAGGYNATTGNTAAYTPATGGDFGAFVEQELRNLITTIAESQDMIGVTQIVTSLKNRELVSRVLTGLASFRRDYGRSTQAMTAVASVDYYKSDFGLHKIMFNRWQPKNIIFFIDPRYWELRYLQEFEILPLARSGHAVKRLIKVEFGLGSKHEKASGMLVDVKDGA